ncbi:MAG: Gfo/Idh/MocA family protein [Armatimonadota bacterium]
MEPIRVGMVGVSHFGKYRRERMRDTGVFRLLACYDYNPAAAEEARREDGCAVAESYDALLDNPEIEAIVVCTSGLSHADYSIRAAQAGKHFFVEKPLCSTRDEMAAILEAGERASVVMGMGHNAPGDPLVERYLRDGKFGEIAAVELFCSTGGAWLHERSPWRYVREKNPGGYLFNCGIHSIFWLQTTFGRVVEVMAMMRYDFHKETSSADTVAVLMRLESGLMATITCNNVTAYHHAHYIYGTLGNLYITSYPTEILYQARNTSGSESGFEGWGEPRIPVDLAELDAHPEDVTLNLVTWAKAIRGEGAPNPSIYDGAAALQVILSAVESADTGRLVQVPDVRAHARQL